MKLSNSLYLLILPLLMTPSLNAKKDNNTAANIESIVFEEDFHPDRRCERNLRAAETANRYLEKELYTMERELARANRKIKRMELRMRNYEKELSLYQDSRRPRRPQAHGYEYGAGNGYGYGNGNGASKGKSRKKSRHY